MKEKISGGDFVPPEAINAGDIKDVLDNPFDVPLIDEFLGKKSLKDVLLMGASVESFGFGEYAVLEFNGSGTFRSNSGTVIDQVKKLLAKYGSDDFKPVWVHVTKKTNKQGQIYFSLLG